MNRILSIAWREFSATAMTKGFIIGAVVIPLVAVATIPLIIFLVLRAPQPQITGTVAVLDGTGQVVPAMQQLLDPEALAARLQEQLDRVKRKLSVTAQGTPLEKDLEQGMEMGAGALPKVEQLTVEALSPGSNIDEELAAIRGTGARDGGRLALVVIDPDAVMAAPGKTEFGGYQVFHVPKLDDRVIDDIRYAAREAIRTTRLKANGMEPERIKALNTVVARSTEEVTATGTSASTGELNQILPIAFMILLIMSVMVGGQYLLTTTIEEKSNRVVEVLLSAVSPIQLMTGKILGQMAVGLVLLVVYSGLGMGALAVFALTYLIDPMTLVYLAVFFVIAYFLVASMLAAVGSAVNDLREAQSLQTPVMLAIMIPYFLWMPITRDPNSVFSIVLSLVPPMSPFVMMLRITSTSPPPTWQILLSIAIGAAAVYAAVWAAAKVFRVGLLMFGKPPNMATLIKWIRMA